MIVKGHDFPNVTLVGILAADLSLYSSDFRCGERTFQLLTQAAGSSSFSFNWKWLLIPLGVGALGCAGYFGQKGYKHYINKKRGYE